MTKTKSEDVLPVQRPTTTSLETIDPVIAKKMLDSSLGNRSISKTRVHSMAEDIERGNWKGWAGPIHIDTQGRLINGHHRLHAIIVADQAVQQSVARDVPDDTIEAIDTGRARTIGDVLSMPTRHYVLNGVSVAAVINRTHTILNGHTAVLSVARVTTYREAIGEPLALGMRWLQKAKLGRLPNPSVVAASLLLVYKSACARDQKTRENSEVFCEDVSSSSGMPQDPAYTVTRWVVANSRPLSPWDVFGRIASAHDAALASKQLLAARRNDEAARKYRDEALETWARPIFTP